MQEDSQPKVSIVIPVYNGCRYLKAAIDSVLGQNYPDIELIVLDDGSTDDSPVILDRYGDAFFKERHANMGQAATLNKGWNMAKGDILSYLSADDVLMPFAVHTAVQHMVHNPQAVLAYCGFNLIDPYSKIIRKVVPPDFEFIDMVSRLVCHPGPGVFFRKWAFYQTGGWDSSLRQMPDLDYWLRLGLIGPFVRIPEVLAAFRLHDQSMTFSKASPSNAAEPVRIIEKFFRNSEALPDDVAAVHQIALSNAHLLSAQLHLRAGRLADTVSAVRRAATYAKSNTLSPRSLRLLANALFNRFFHQVLWAIRHKASTGVLSAIR
jgi:glycosyltransferase involved in cell wall biosynthesis